MKNKVNIIGAGFSGLSAAANLSAAGLNVDVFEKNSIVGGRARVLEENGYRFDMGPSWYWMPEVFEDFFRKFGHASSDFYKLKRLDPGYRMYFGKDDYLDVPADLNELYSLFEGIETGSAKKLEKFLKRAEYKYNTGVGKLVYLPANSIFEFMRWDLIKGLVKLDFFKSVSSYVQGEFKDKRLRQILEFPVIFLGATPQKTPALYTLMNYADLKLGTWYPEGGMFSVVEGMAKVAEEYGAKIHLNSNVENILVKDKLVNGLTVNGKELLSDVVVGSADYNHVEQQLLPKEYRRYNKKYWDSRVMAPSSLLFFIGVNKRLLNLQHHNLFFDADFSKHAAQIYEDPRWPDDPAIYVSCNSYTDPTVAPEGHENLVILIPVAPGLKDSEEIREHFYKLVMERLERITNQEIVKYVVYKKSYAHNDFIHDYNAFRGNAYGLANTLMQTAILKPAIRNLKLKNLFYTGQLTVPGPGVPPAIISGHVVSNEILKYLKSS